ncbi:MAG: MATE family efflux transporter [Flavobacteriales bacterium]|jgi:putative MATE family efflux protein|nr:MATE family efflux transporter [Flavobacteriales bacterium]
MSTNAISYSSIWKLTLPIIISGVTQNIVAVIDTLFLSQLGKVELGAAGNGALFYYLIITMGMGISTGSQIMIAKANGAKNYTSIGAIIEQSLYIFLPLAVFIFIGLQLFYPTFATTISQSNEIAASATTFVSFRAYGVLFAFLNFLFIAFFVATKKTNVLFYSSIVVAIVNIGLDYGLIFGNLGFPQWGVKGAAIASVVAELASILFFVIYAIKHVNFKQYHFQINFQIHRKLIQKILGISTPIAFQNFLTFGSWFIFFSIIEQLGEDELAISHVIRSIYMLMMIPLLGFSTSTNTLVSNLIGAGKQELVLRLIGRTLILALLSSGAVVVITTLFGTEIVAFYQLEQQLVPHTLSTLTVINYVLFFFTIAFVLFNAVVGTGKTRVSLFIEAINITIYLTAAFTLVNYFSPSIEQVWCVEFFYFTFLSLMSFAYLKYGKWRAINELED